MNYERIYEEIIDRRKEHPVSSGYKENHHRIPKSLGGDDSSENMVYLTAREHFICHILLAKMYPKYSNAWYKMNHALMIMKCESVYQNRYFNSRLYEHHRKNFSNVMCKSQTGKGNSQYGKMWICNVELKENRKIPKNDFIPDGWIKGRNKWKNGIIYPDKICPTCKTVFNTRSIHCCQRCSSLGKTHTDDTKQKMSKQKIGNKSLSGLIWVTDGEINKAVLPNEVPKNFKRGRC